MLNSKCPIHGDATAKANGQVCTCIKVTFIVSDGTTMTTADWNKNLKAMREWKVTLHGYIGERTPVPPAFQNEFKDGELEP